MNDTDEQWARRVRAIGADVVPPTPADPRALANTAIRRARTRRALLVGGGGAAALAVVAGSALAMNGFVPATASLPGSGSQSETSVSASAAANDGSATPPAEGRTTLGALSYAAPPDVVPAEPADDEPGVTSDMWHDRTDPDSPPWIVVQQITPEAEYHGTDAGGLTQEPGPDATPIDLEGAQVATLEQDTDHLREAAGLIGADASGAGQSTVLARIQIHPEGSDDRYTITMSLPAGDHDALIQDFADSLSLG